MNKAYLAKIIAKDSQGLQLISAYCSRAKLKVDEIKKPALHSAGFLMLSLYVRAYFINMIFWF